MCENPSMSCTPNLEKVSYKSFSSLNASTMLRMSETLIKALKYALCFIIWKVFWTQWLSVVS